MRRIFMMVLVAGMFLSVSNCDKSNDDDGSGSGGDGSNGQGWCRSTCPKACSGDADCDTAGGQMCCDFGNGSKACTEPQDCPRFCSTDSECKTEHGEACCAVTLASEKQVCSQPQLCQQFCRKNADCSENKICCTTYSESICVEPEECPRECASTVDCVTEEGEVCCKSLDDNLAEQLSISGVCFPKGLKCQNTCSTSQDCDSASGEICCEGFCSKSCQKQCKENQDCDMAAGQLCCQNSVVESPWWNLGMQSLFSPTAQSGCCSNSNPCDWDDDGTCDCDGDYGWDWMDCERGGGEDTTSGYSDTW